MSAIFMVGPKVFVPLAFLSYAGIVNIGFVQDIIKDPARIPKAAIDYFDGAAALQIDAYYKSIMLHRSSSIDLMGALRYVVFHEGRSGVVVGQDGWLFSNEEFRAAGDMSQAVAEAVYSIVEIRAELAAKGVDLVIVPLPAKADIYSEHLSEQSVPTDLADTYATLEGALREAGVNVIDSRPALLDAKVNGAVFLKTDTHWTPRGAAAVAAAVAAGMQIDSTTSYSTVETAPILRDGDLSKFVTGVEMTEALGLGPEMIVPRQAVPSGDAALGDIFGGGAIPVALVGTSYSANTMWSFAESLKIDLGSDVLNVAEEGLGPVAPMRKYLAGDTLHDAPPDVVIWEFPMRYLENARLWDAPSPTLAAAQ